VVGKRHIPAPVTSQIRPRNSCLPRLPKPNLDRYIDPLTRLGSDFGSGTLSTLLALDALTSTLSSTGGGLGLVSLLLGLGGCLLLLGVLDGLLASGGTGLGALGAALLDNVEGGTDDGTLVLDDTASALLGNFLFKLKSSVSIVSQIPSCILQVLSECPPLYFF
jgi:hypothetical protein